MTPDADGGESGASSGSNFDDRFDEHRDRVLGDGSEQPADGGPGEEPPTPADRDGARTIVQGFDYAVRMLTGAPLPDDTDLDFQTPEGRAEFFAAWVEPAYRELRQTGVEINPWLQASLALLLIGAIAWAEGALLSGDDEEEDSGGGLSRDLRSPESGGGESEGESTLAEEKAESEGSSGQLMRVGKRAE